MKTARFPIAAADYDHAGSASSGLKELLKKVGVEPETLRRAMIAAYEAEMNVVIHSLGGQMHIELDDRQIDVVVLDDGPGIPDVGLAMQEGYSTAPPKARQLGFGAGLGLPNIRKKQRPLRDPVRRGPGHSRPLHHPPASSGERLSRSFALPGRALDSDRSRALPRRRRLRAGLPYAGASRTPRAAHDHRTPVHRLRGLRRGVRYRRNRSECRMPNDE